MTRLNRSFRGQFVFSFITVVFFVISGFAGNAQDRTAWMKEARWGVMNHYLADWIARREKIRMSVEEWNKLIDNFDVEGLANQIESVGVGHYLITIGQNSGYYLSPNATYDSYVGIKPGKCSRRDLVADLYEALHKPMEKGHIEFVQIQSQVGGECRLHNPWPDKSVTLYRNGKKAEDLSGSMLKFPTAPGETVTAVLQGTKPSRKEVL